MPLPATGCKAAAPQAADSEAFLTFSFFSPL
jgi:hypothetical protein